MAKRRANLGMHNYKEVHKKRKTEQIDDVDSFRGWEELQNGPLVEIAERLSNYEDFEALHLVCHRWNSALRSSRCKFLASGHVGHCTFQVPWLLMADQEREAESNVSSSLRPCSTKSNTMRLFFYRLSFDRVHQMAVKLPPQLDIDQRNFKEWSLLSSRGWLFIVTKRKTMSLYNPLCCTTHNYYIPLPENRLLATHAKRFTLSACPCTNRYTVMLTYGNKLAFWKSGDEDWTFVIPFSYMSGFVLDVTYYKRHVVALNNCGEVYIMCKKEDRGEDHKPRPELFALNIASLFPECTEQYLWKAYFVFVESSQKLLVVVRVPLQPAERYPFDVSDDDHLTVGFRVMEILVPTTPTVNMSFTPIVDEYMERVKEVNNLGNISLFVGRNQSFAVEEPHSSYYGCKPNCIYFTDDRLLGRPTIADCGKGKDMGVYNMADGSIARHFQGESLADYSPMLWV